MLPKFGPGFVENNFHEFEEDVKAVTFELAISALMWCFKMFLLVNIALNLRKQTRDLNRWSRIPWLDSFLGLFGDSQQMFRSLVCYRSLVPAL